MKAVIMAGGEGTRLRPLTCNRPKPMVPIGNKPVMEHIIELLKKHGLNDIAVTLQYMPELIKEYFHDGRGHDVNIEYFVEKTPLGTAGSVKNAQSFLDDTFIVISGDALTDIDLKKAIEFHHRKSSIATLILKKVEVPLEYGVVVTDDNGKIIRFLEKPSWGEVFSDTVNTGIYILSPIVLDYFNKNEMFDFSRDLFPILLKEGKPMYGFITEDYWCDIGDLKAYIHAHEDILERRVKVNIPGTQIQSKVWVDEGAEIEEGVIINSPCIIGKHVKIKKGATIEGLTIIGDNSVINERSSIKRSIIWKNNIIDRNVQLRGAVLCNKVHMGYNSSAFEYSVIGDNTVINENAIIKPNIKIWPHKIIESGVEINSNLIWGSQATRSIFGNRGVAGEINVDITPEYASKLGAAYGALFKEKGVIGISCDPSNAAQMLKTSFISGILSSGMEVFDFGKMLLPITRSAIRFYKADGGIHISTTAECTERLFIDFLDRNGSNIERSLERKIENAFAREDFSRCEGDCIKEVKEINGYSSFYLRSIVNSVRTDSLKFKIAINSSSQFVSTSISSLLEELGCNVEFINLEFVNSFINFTKMGKFDLGVSFEDNSEKMMLVDDKGRIITEDVFIALISLILFKTMKGGTVVVPISASQVIEELANEYSGKVIRSKTSTQDIMGKIWCNGTKEDMVDQFTMHFDAIAGLVKILDFISENNYRLSDLVDMIPEFHIDKREVECPWNAKGKVIRQIIQEQKGKSIETLEGVKIYQDGGWVLILPDGERPVCKVISESYSAEFAEELTNIYINKIQEISKKD